MAFRRARSKRRVKHARDRGIGVDESPHVEVDGAFRQGNRLGRRSYHRRRVGAGLPSHPCHRRRVSAVIVAPPLGVRGLVGLVGDHHQQDIGTDVPLPYSGLATVLLYRGDIAGVIAAGEFLAQLQPDLSAIDAFNLATAYVLADRGAAAVRILEQAHDRNRALLETNVILAAAYAEVGRQQEAERQAESVRQRFPGFSSEAFGSLLRDPSQRERLARSLKKAGL